MASDPTPPEAEENWGSGTTSLDLSYNASLDSSATAGKVGKYSTEFRENALDQLRAMRTFVTVAETGSLSAAARKTGQPLTTVSRLLASLEDHAGINLIARTTRRLALTSAGKDYLETCRRIFEELDGAESRIAGRKGDLTGELVITAPVVFGRLHVLPIIGRFLKQHPHLDARLVLADRIVDLTEDGIDAALRIGPLPDSSLIATRVGTLRLLTCAAPDYLRVNGRIAKPEDLATHPCIVFSNLGGGGRWIFKSRDHGRRAVRPKARLSVNTAEAAIDAAIAGLGVTRVLSYQAEAALKARHLKTVLDSFDDTTIPVHLVHRAGKLPKPPVPLFIDFAAKELRARLK
jgi:DNA-binding transcriptional LysR family regulator